VTVFLYTVMVGEGRPSTSFLRVSKKDVDGGAKPRHDVESYGAMCA
jgi:hypothetical protein